MSASAWRAIVTGNDRTVSANGQVTLPKSWRDEHDVGEGDIVAMRQTDQGTLEIIPPPNDDEIPEGPER